MKLDLTIEEAILVRAVLYQGVEFIDFDKESNRNILKNIVNELDRKIRSNTLDENDARK